MINNLQFFVSNTCDPYHNLAVEKLLFDTVAPETLILYLWQNKNTVVIGKNQNAFSECRTELLKQEGGLLARRLSGGGAVFHDLGNLNFTFLCSTDNLNIPKHIDVIREACRLAGIETELSGRNDILANGRKFSGNAFYNSKGHSYHHGTILIDADMDKLGRYLTPPKAKLESKGIQSVRSRVINLTELAPTLTPETMKQRLLDALETVYSLVPTAASSPDEKKTAELARRFADREYLLGSPIPFNVSFEGRMPFGHAELKLCVENGVIVSARLYTDALDTEFSTTVENTLLSLPFDLPIISDSLVRVLNDADALALITLLAEQIFI